MSPLDTGTRLEFPRWADGAGSENRTRDIRITSAVLYQLSYPGRSFTIKTRLSGGTILLYKKKSS
jgi:hypothetical protein